MSSKLLGLDIGGANLKAANAAGFALQRPFALWRAPEKLTNELGMLLREAPPFERLAITMTGELCDCYATKRDGVNAILDAVAAAHGGPAVVWRTDGQFCDLPTARSEPHKVAAGNWLATATFAGRFAPRGAALLVDIGSTTTDIVPMWNGLPAPTGRTDPARMAARELVYTGARRTPLCALLGPEVAAELFATTLDVYLVLKRIPEDPSNRDTADGRPATRSFAHARLARMLGGDAELTTDAATRALAEKAARVQQDLIRRAIATVAAQLPGPVQTVITAGSGEFLARDLFEKDVDIVSWSSMLGAGVAAAACAYAVAVLASELSSG